MRNIMRGDSSGTPKTFADQITLLKQGEHLCSVYSDSGEMLTQVVPYMKAGLLRGERCLYVADESATDTVVQALKTWGVDADAEMSKRRLVFWTRHDYRQPGAFDVDVMLSFIRRTLSQALVDGHDGIRLAVEMSWTINNAVDEDDLVRWEDLINTISFPGSQVSFLCQYNTRLLASHLVTKAVRVHPVVVLGKDICPNRYCCTADEILDARDNIELEALLAKIKAPAAPAAMGQGTREPLRSAAPPPSPMES